MVTLLKVGVVLSMVIGSNADDAVVVVHGGDALDQIWGLQYSHQAQISAEPIAPPW